MVGVTERSVWALYRRVSINASPSGARTDLIAHLYALVSTASVGSGTTGTILSATREPFKTTPEFKQTFEVCQVFASKEFWKLSVSRNSNKTLHDNAKRVGLTYNCIAPEMGPKT